MCGITGLFSRNGLNSYRSALLAANKIIDHRGPDGQGIALFDTRRGKRYVSLNDGVLPDEQEMSDKTLALEHRRLAILDLSPSGLQPMTNEDESLWIIYNGEIYNYIELRLDLEKEGHHFRSTSDTEVILHAYETWGEACVTRFNGMWAFAIADLNQQKLFCSRDRFGIKPFYYYFDEHVFLFASEIKQLLCFPFVQRQINERAVYEFLAFAAVEYGEETFFSNIYKLLHSHNLIFNLKEHTLIKSNYYRPHFSINSQITLPEAASEFRRLLTDSVKLRLRSDVEVGSCLSGGLDSSSIVCIMHKLLLEQGKTEFQRTFSSHFDEEEANELEYMQTVIQATGVQAQFTYPTVREFLEDMECVVWHQDEPFGSSSIFAQWSVFKLVHQHGIKVMLDGQGADEQLAGYLSLTPYYFADLLAKRHLFQLAWEKWRHKRLHNKPWTFLVPARIEDIFLPFLGNQNNQASVPNTNWIRPDFKERYHEQSQYLLNMKKQPFSEAEHLNNILYQLTFLNNLQSLLRYEDRNSMAFSVEARVPFLDYRLVEFIFSLPADFKVRNGYTKRVLRDGMAGVIPDKIRWRTGKLGFATPEHTWQRSALRPKIKDALENDKLTSFILPDQALAYLDLLEKCDQRDSAPWRWINLHLWMKVYGLT